MAKELNTAGRDRNEERKWEKGKLEYKLDPDH